MVLPAEDLKVSEDLLAAIESNLMGAGIRVVSTGTTGQIALDPAIGGGSGAARLPQLDRAMILLRQGNVAVDCVFQLLKVNIEPNSGDLARHFLWNGPGRGFQEVPENVARTADQTHVWRLWGETWTISGKVVDVRSGDVLAVIWLQQSSVRSFPRHMFQVPASPEALIPTSEGYRGLRLERAEDLQELRAKIMSRMTELIAGPSTPGSAIH